MLLGLRRLFVWGVVLGIAVGTSRAALGQTHQLVYAKDGSGIFGYKDTPIQPWSGYHVHDPDRPAPKKIDPGEFSSQDRPGIAPSDAVVLFDGKDLSQWLPTQWKLDDGCLLATQGRLASKQKFGSCQVHLEWQAPAKPVENQMNQGNNGVFFGEEIEVQIFDSYRTKIYPDGQAASIYAQTPPLVNVCRKPGQWEVFDIVYLAPKFGKGGKLLEPARITMLHNGVLVHLNQEVYGASQHADLAGYDSVKAKATLGFEAHSCPVRFRNIWVRPLKDEPTKR